MGWRSDFKALENPVRSPYFRSFGTEWAGWFWHTVRMYMPGRPSKDLAKRAIVRLVPEYLELFGEVRRENGWQRVHRALAEVRRRLNIPGYVALYDSEPRLNASLVVALLGANGAGELEAELRALPPEALQREVDELGAEALRDGGLLDELFPDDPEKEQAALAALEALSPEGKAEAIRQAQFLCCFLLAFFHNTVSVMVHGEKLTSLVPKAIAGEREAFLKAIHIDKNLIRAHPGFVEQHERALGARDERFLRNVGNRLAASPVQGRIRQPGVYLVFAMLELFGWLDELRHGEILDLCDAAGIERWQNRIEDVNYLTKRYVEYRRMQQSGGLSMH